VNPRAGVSIRANGGTENFLEIQNWSGSCCAKTDLYPIEPQMNSGPEKQKAAAEMSELQINLKPEGTSFVESETNSKMTTSESTKPKSNPRPKKLMSKVNIWIRRIHLFSGLFMLPWVLLYGFTAMLFNHPTYMTDWNTSIEHFTLPESQANLLPSADQLAQLAQLALASATEQLDGQQIELSEPLNATFTRQVSGSVENDDRSVTVVLNMNDGSGYLRKRIKKKVSKGETDSNDNQESASLDDGLKFKISSDPFQAFKSGVKTLVAAENLETDRLKIRSMPNIEFDALIDGQPVRMRLSQERSRSGSSDDSDSNSQNDANPVYNSKLTIVGSSPREMSARRFLLRLHTAHGYGIQKNSRWFWAIAVDLMFASMCFWGISGVVMWWQIKRTRRLGFILLAASAIVATWLAIGMHWQLVNG
jgi:hypothetical protein